MTKRKGMYQGVLVHPLLSAKTFEIQWCREYFTCKRKTL